MILLKRWLPSVILSLVIFTLSSQPGAVVSEVRVVDVVSHKTAHVVLYFLLYLSFFRAVKRAGFAALLTIIYGVTDELHQQLVPTRAGTVADIIVDAIAALSAWMFLWKYFQSLPTKLKDWLLE